VARAATIPVNNTRDFRWITASRNRESEGRENVGARDIFEKYKSELPEHAKEFRRCVGFGEFRNAATDRACAFGDAGEEDLVLTRKKSVKLTFRHAGLGCDLKSACG
jgi:hypothetical protein